MNDLPGGPTPGDPQPRNGSSSVVEYGATVIVVVAILAAAAHFGWLGLDDLALRGPAEVAERAPGGFAKYDQRQPGGAPTPPANVTFDEETSRAWDALAIGDVAYEPARRMTEGHDELVTVQIARDRELDLSDFQGQVVVERIKVGGIMSATLTASRQDDFEIVTITNAQQAVPPATQRKWAWRVTPLRSGTLALDLRLSVQIITSAGVATHHDLLVKSARITVDAAPAWRVRRFFVKHWQWVLGSSFSLGLISVLWGGWRAWRSRKPPKAPAGFKVPLA